MPCFDCRSPMTLHHGADFQCSQTETISIGEVWLQRCWKHRDCGSCRGKAEFQSFARTPWGWPAKRVPSRLKLDQNSSKYNHRTGTTKSRQHMEYLHNDHDSLNEFQLDALIHSLARRSGQQTVISIFIMLRLRESKTRPEALTCILQVTGMDCIVRSKTLYVAQA